MAKSEIENKGAALPGTPPGADAGTVALLHGKGISSALIIDDAYDPLVRDDYEEDISEFWERVIRDDDALAELRQLGISGAEDIDDARLKTLWDAREAASERLAEPIQILFSLRIEKQRPLNMLADHLRRFEVKPHFLGGREAFPDEPHKLVFLDYYLGVADDASAVGVSTNKASDLYRRSKDDAGKPFIVLMSSTTDADAAKENFRRSSGLLAGLFGYVPKSDLRDLEKLRLRLVSWAIGLPARHEIQRFVEAMELALKNATEPFFTRLRGLSLEDYVNLQWLSLQPDGHPLGDYMVWLYKSLLAHLLHGDEGVLDQQRKLDAMSFDSFLPAQGRASVQLAELFWHALTEPGVGDVGPHPRAPAASPEPYLHLGDLFGKPRGKDVLLVVNAACDLTYSPGTARKFPHDHTILFARGTIGQLEEDPRPHCVKTEPFHHEGHAVRITWDPKRMIAREYGEVWGWLKAEGYVRYGRLCLAYALEVQQSIASNLTRVGMPVRPPGWHVPVELFCAGGDGNPAVRLGGPIPDGAFIARRVADGGEANHFVLTVDCITAVMGALDDAIAEYERQQAVIAGPGGATEASEDGHASKVREGKSRGLQGKIDKLHRLKQENAVWTTLQAFQPLPKPQAYFQADPKLLWVWRDGPFHAHYSGSPVAVNLRLATGEADASDGEASAEPVKSPTPFHSNSPSPGDASKAEGEAGSAAPVQKDPDNG
jgi:hypothetical protein